MNKLLRQFLSLFSAACFEDAAEVVVDELPVEVVADEESAVSGSDEEIDGYLGSDEVNPDRRPLKDMDRTGMSKSDIDALIAAAGDEVFLSDDQIAEINKAKEEEKGDNTNVDDEIKLGGDDKPKDDPVDESIKEFYEKSGIKQEEFDALSPEIQEKVTSLYEKTGPDEETTKLVADYSTKTSEMQKVIDSLTADPIVAARIEEKKTGRKYVAEDLPAVTTQELEALSEVADNPEELRIAVNELIASKAEVAVTVQNSISDQRTLRKSLEKDALVVVQEIMGIEKRLAVKESDLSNIKEGHPEYDKLYGKDGIMGILKESGYTLKKIKDFGAKRVLNDISYAKGWNVDREKQIEKNGGKKLIQKIREAKEKARTIDMGKKSTSTGRITPDEYDRDSLVSEIATGNLDTWNRLIEDAGSRGDSTRVAELSMIREEAVKSINKQKKEM